MSGCKELKKVTNSQIENSIFHDYTTSNLFVFCSPVQEKTFQ